MELKFIKTYGIEYIQPLDGSGFYYGTDCCGGDMYEAQELFASSHRIASNRLIFASYPAGELFEPLAAEPGQYLGSPVFSDGGIFFPLVDFRCGEIHICKCAPDMLSAAKVITLPLGVIPDCYNLSLHASPLTLTRQGHENRFQVIWPDSGDFAIDPRESFIGRCGGELLFSKWREDPDYHEDTIVRRYPTGEIIEEISGSLIDMPDGQKWILA